MKPRKAKQSELNLAAPKPLKEDRLQINCIRWFDIQYPRLQMLLFHIPNEGERSAAYGGKLKAMGMRAGVSDLLLSIPNKFFHGFYIEIKQEGKKQRPNQAEFQAKVESMGYLYAVLDTIEDFINAVQNYLSLTPFHKPSWKEKMQQEQQQNLPLFTEK